MQKQQVKRQLLSSKQAKRREHMYGPSKRSIFPSLPLSPLRRSALASCVVSWLVAIALISYAIWMIIDVFFEPPLASVWQLWIRSWSFHIPDPNPLLLYSLCIGLLILVATYIGYAVYRTKIAITEWKDWKQFSHLRAVYNYRHLAAMGLKYYLTARFWTQQRRFRNKERPAFIEEADIHTISRSSDRAIANISYNSLANLPFPSLPLPFMYKNLPEPSISSELQEEVSSSILENNPLPPLPQEKHIYEEKRTISVLGDLIIRIGGEASQPVVIKDDIQQELLAFIISESRYKDIKGDDILSQIYEVRYPDRDTDKLRRLLHKDAMALREFFKKAAMVAGIPDINPLPVARGPHAIWRLDLAYVVVDLAFLSQVRMEWEAIKKGNPANIEHFRNAWDEAKKLYAKGFLKRLVQTGATGRWVRDRYRQYREEFRQLSIEIAEYEKAMGERTPGDKQHLYFRHAALLYKDYAFASIPIKGEDVEQGGQIHLSEQGLRQSIILFARSGDREAASRTYYEYIEAMKRKFPTWKEDVQTTRAWQSFSDEEI